MQCLRFYAVEGMRVAHQSIVDWLFDAAQSVGITGGTAFRAAAGFGRHGLHEDRFFELAGALPEAVEFIAEAPRLDALIAHVRAAGVQLLFIRYAVEAGHTGP